MKNQRLLGQALLTCHAYRAVALFLDAGVINDESAAGATAEQAVGAAGDFVHERAMLPRRVTDGVVNALIVEIRNVFFHSFEVFGSAFGLHEAEEVALDLSGVVIAARAEETGEVFHEGDEATDCPSDVL